MSLNFLEFPPVCFLPACSGLGCFTSPFSQESDGNFARYLFQAAAKTSVYEHVLSALKDLANVNSFNIKDNHGSFLERLADVP